MTIMLHHLQRLCTGGADTNCAGINDTPKTASNVCAAALAYSRICAESGIDVLAPQCSSCTHQRQLHDTWQETLQERFDLVAVNSLRQHHGK